MIFPNSDGNAPAASSADARARAPNCPPALPPGQAHCRELLNAALEKVAQLEERIEQQQRREQEWREGELRTTAILATAMDAVMTVDSRQRVVIFNAAAEAMFGCPASEAIGSTIERFLPERFRQPHREHVRKFLAGGATLRAMGRLQLLFGLRMNGEEFPIEASISKVETKDGLLATVVVRDITARRTAEAALENSEQRLRLAQQIGRIGAFDWNLTDNQIQWSAEIAGLYGLPARAFESPPGTWQELIHPDDRDAFEQLIGRALSSGTFDGEWRVRWPDGSLHWLAGRAVVYKDEAGRAQRMLGVNIDITERKESEERIRRVAQHDALTGLPNRALLYEFAEHLLPAMRRTHRVAAFLFIDLDRFKPINDTYGHDIGDAVLKEVARRLMACLRAEDMVGRIGGDEFVAVLANIHSEDDAAVIAFHVLDRLERPYFADGIELRLSPSIGISLFPQDGNTVDELIKHADIAMYNAKQNGRGNFQFFQAELNARSEEALRIESRLHKALELNEFELYLQPVINLVSGKIVAAEALIRWPTMGFPPDRFIPVAEMAGFMPPLGNWILKEACRLRRQWRDEGLPAFPVAINVSSTQFRQSSFLPALLQIVDQAGLQAGDLKLEVTESVLINNLEDAANLLRDIRRMGINVALDDFGTGYSSLSYLTQLPVDSVKLDQSFVRNLDQDHGSAVIVESVLNLAQSLHLDVVAEGIESPAALAFLNKHHCQHGQGFLFSRPLPARDFERWCRHHQAA